MGLHLGPRCPDCDKPLRISIIGRGCVVPDMLFCISHCPRCGAQYDAYCNPLGKWFFREDIPPRILELKKGLSVDLCEPWNVLLGYSPE